MGDWVDDEKRPANDLLFPERERERVAREAQALVFAQRYLVFQGPTADPRAKALFEHWAAQVRKQVIAPNASPQEYAYWEGRREFVEGINAQIEFANNGASSPPPRTTP